MRDAIPPRQKLREFMAQHARSDTDIEFYLILIDEALARFTLTLPPAKDVAKKARALAAAAMKFAEALEGAIAPETHGGGAIMREGTASIWWALRIADLIGDHDFGDDYVSALRLGTSARPARRFDTAAGNRVNLLWQTKAVERQARRAAEVFSTRNRPPNLKVRILSRELAAIWKEVTGIDHPRSLFGTFVTLALDTTGWASRDKIPLKILSVISRKK
jgi:hypothetical protein